MFAEPSFRTRTVHIMDAQCPNCGGINSSEDQGAIELARNGARIDVVCGGCAAKIPVLRRLRDTPDIVQAKSIRSKFVQLPTYSTPGGER